MKRNLWLITKISRTFCITIILTQLWRRRTNAAVLLTHSSTWDSNQTVTKSTFVPSFRGHSVQVRNRLLLRGVPASPPPICPFQTDKYGSMRGDGRAEAPRPTLVWQKCEPHVSLVFAASPPTTVYGACTHTIFSFKSFFCQWGTFSAVGTFISFWDEQRIQLFTAFSL